MLVHHPVLAAAERCPDAPAVVWHDEVTTFAQLTDRLAGWVRVLSELTAPGDRVAMVADNHPAWIEAYSAVPAAGRQLVFLNQRQHPEEWATLLRRTDTSVVVGDRHHLERLSGVVGPDDGLRARICIDAPAPGDLGLDDLIAAAGGDVAALTERVGQRDTDPAWIIFTSGTTGAPKGAVLTHRSILAAVETTDAARPVADDEVYLFPFPLCHVAGYNIVLHHHHARPVVLVEGFTARGVLDAIQRHGVTAMSLAPTMIALLLDAPERGGADLSTLRSIGYGASAIPPAVLRRALDELAVDLSQGYGMTELSGNAVFLNGEDHRRAVTDRADLLSSCGTPSPLVEVRVVDATGTDVPDEEVGEIVVRGPQVLSHYLDDSEATAAAFFGDWFRTGDLGRWRRDHLHVVDRMKDIIITGGENVASREVEDVVSTHPAVAAAAVVGIDDPVWGERVCAVVVPRDPDVGVDFDDVERHVRAHLAGYKVPRRWLVTDELPVNASGKVLKRELRDQLAAS